MNAKERSLINFFRKLDQQQKSSLLSYAEFLSTQTPVLEKQIEQPHDIPAAENESVVAALRRLSKSYFMLENQTLLNDATNLMSQHVIQGRDALEVIGELEELFRLGYQSYIVEIESREND